MMDFFSIFDIFFINISMQHFALTEGTLVIIKLIVLIIGYRFNASNIVYMLYITGTFTIIVSNIDTFNTICLLCIILYISH